MTGVRRRRVWRLTAVTLCLALGWPLSAGAVRGRAAAGEPDDGREPAEAEPSTGAEAQSSTRAEAEPSTGAEAQPSTGAEAEPSTGAEAEPSTDEPAQPKVGLTPEELAQRQLDRRYEQADIHWLEGQRLYNNGRYAEAAVEFERSYVAVPAAATLYGMALSYERAGKPVEAVRALERYLALPDCPDGPLEQRLIDCAAQRSEAEQALAEQRRRVGALVLDLGEGVELREVRVAGRTVPLDDFPLLLLPGTVDVEVFGMGPDERRSRPAYITGGETYELYVAPFDSGRVPPPEVRPELDDPVDALRQARRQRQLRTAFWAGTGLTASAGIALAVVGGITRYHQRRFDTEKCDRECWEEDENGMIIYDDRPFPLDHELAVQRYRPVTNAMLGVTIGLGVATALVGAFAFRKLDDAPGDERPRARAHVRLGGSGLVVRW